jgi:VWFA-related protein
VPALGFAQASEHGSTFAEDAASGHALRPEQGLIKLDVVVTDQSGKPVTGLGPNDFTLLDNGQPNKILSFQAFDGVSAKPDPPVEVILLIDTVDLPSQVASEERNEVERFLRQSGGHLAQPVSVLGLLDSGLWVYAWSSRDGNALAAAVAQNKKQLLDSGAQDSDRVPFPGQPTVTRSTRELTLQAIGSIAVMERQKPGRKLLVWIGPGWENGGFEPSDDRQQLSEAIVWFSTLLLEARIALYSLPMVAPDRPAESDPLGRRMLAVESGGRVLASTSDSVIQIDLVRQIESCVEEASAFYTLSFDPSHADLPNEVHGLKVLVGKPGLTARSNTGYYDQPYYLDQPDPAVKRVTVEQLEQVLVAARGERDGEVARRLSDLELTERLSAAKLSGWMASLHGKNSRQVLTALADASAFLDPPAAEIPARTPPDLTEQRRIVFLAIDYLKNTFPKLPNFFATRTKIRYEEPPEQVDQNSLGRTGDRRLRLADSSEATVFYRNGHEVVDSEVTKRNNQKEQDEGLITNGVFGPILGMVILDAITTHSHLTWGHWEQGTTGPLAVFRYAIPEDTSHFDVWQCCPPDGDGTTFFRKLAGYHGEIAVDPASGSILRLVLQADLNPPLPLVRSDTLIEYGPVEIGGIIYICPVRSVAISRGRTVRVMQEWAESFSTYGPYETMLNDVSFGNYHVFRSESRILTGATPAPDEK